MRGYSVIIALLLVVLFIPNAEALLIYSQNFGNLTLGNLNGQDNYSGHIVWKVKSEATIQGKHASAWQAVTGETDHYVDRPLGSILKAGNMTGLAKLNTTDGSKIDGVISFLNGTNILGSIYVVQGGSVSYCGAFFGSTETLLNSTATGMRVNYWNNFTIKFTNKTGFTACCGNVCKQGLNYNSNVGLPDGIRLWSKPESSGSGVSSFDNITVYDNTTFGASISIIEPQNITYRTNINNIIVKNNVVITKWFYKLKTNYSHLFVPNTTMAGFGVSRGFNNLFIKGTMIGGPNLTANVSFTLDYVELEEEGNATSAYETDKTKVWLDLKIWNWSAVENVSVALTFNKTAGNVTTGYNNNYTSIISIPTVPSTKIVPIYWNYTICYSDSECETRHTDTYNMTISQIGLSACSSGNVTLEFRGKNESDTTESVNFTMGIAVKIGLYSKNFNFSLSGNDTYRLCINPGDENYTADIDIEYYAPSCPIRHYYMRGALLNNATTYVDLFLLHESEADQIDFTVENTDYEEQLNVIVKAMRYYPGLGSYKIVAMGLTGPNGKTSMWLKKDVYFKWLLERDNAVLKLTSPETLTDSTMVLYIDADNRAVIFGYYGKVAYTCSVDTINKLIVCTYSDTSGKMLSMNMTVDKVLLYNRSQTICSRGSVAAADTFVCSYDGYENDTLYYQLKGNFHGSGSEWSIFVSYIIGGVESLFWGEALGTKGIIITLLMVVGLTMFGLYRPDIAIVFSVMGFIVSYLFGFFTIGISSLIGLVLCGGIIVFKMRR